LLPRVLPFPLFPSCASVSVCPKADPKLKVDIKYDAVIPNAKRPINNIAKGAEILFIDLLGKNIF
jgi:hypothetical protein